MTRTAHFTLALSPAGVHPGSQPSTARPVTFDDWAVPASVAERAGIDAVFLPDSPAVPQEGGRRGSLEPLMLLAALARETSTIGLIGTASTSFNEPYNVARQFASLHAISGGRAGWNSVGTSNPGAAANFGVSWWQDHDRRYRVGQEFTEIVLRLWQAGEDPIDHVGEFFAVRGPLDVTAVGGDRPLITQAGGSPEGIRLGARFADVTFAILADLTAAKEYDRRLRDAEAAAGRTYL